MPCERTGWFNQHIHTFMPYKSLTTLFLAYKAQTPNIHKNHGRNIKALVYNESNNFVIEPLESKQQQKKDTTGLYGKHMIMRQ